MKAFKKGCLYLHRYCGWIVGVVFFLLCLTGCILAIQPEIERWLDPTRFKTSSGPDATVMSPGALIEAFERREVESFDEPTKVHVQRLQTSNDPRKTWQALVTADNGRRTWAYLAYIDPTTAQGVAYGSGKGGEFFRSVRRLHASLKIPSENRLGNRIVGYASLIAGVVLITGLVQWVPKQWKNTKTLKNSFRPVLNRGLVRATFDLHNVCGFYAMALLLLLCLSGAWIAVPWFRTSCDWLLGYDATKGAAGMPGVATASAVMPKDGARETPSSERGKSDASGRAETARTGMARQTKDARDDAEDATNYGAGILARRAPTFGGVSPHALAALRKNAAFVCEKVLDKPASLDAIVAEQQKLTPNAPGYEIVAPVAGTDRAATISEYGGFAQFCKPDVYYWDQYTGKLLGTTSFRDLSTSEQIRSLIVPFHTGKIFGAASRYALFAASFIGIVLSVTGYLILAFRRSAKGQARRRSRPRETEGDAASDGAAKLA